LRATHETDTHSQYHAVPANNTHRIRVSDLDMLLRTDVLFVSDCRPSPTSWCIVEGGYAAPGYPRCNLVAHLANLLSHFPAPARAQIITLLHATPSTVQRNAVSSIPETSSGQMHTANGECHSLCSEHRQTHTNTHKHTQRIMHSLKLPLMRIFRRHPC